VGYLIAGELRQRENRRDPGRNHHRELNGDHRTYRRQRRKA
jgi:hypothetical protein